MKIGILGGTGPQGRGLGTRFAASGHDVFIGSRSAERAELIAVEIGPPEALVGSWASTTPTRPQPS